MGVQSHDPAAFTFGYIPVTAVYVAGWDRGPIWKGVENLAHTVTRSAVRPARSESLYRLSDSRPLFSIRYLSIYQPVRKLLPQIKS